MTSRKVGQPAIRHTEGLKFPWKTRFRCGTMRTIPLAGSHQMNEKQALHSVPLFKLLCGEALKTKSPYPNQLDAAIVHMSIHNGIVPKSVKARWGK